MKTERSCGAVIYKIENGEHLFLILRHAAGHWSLAKGHVKRGETEVETAYREIKEETGLDVEIDTKFRVTSEYSPKANTMKEVVFFVAEVVDDAITLQESEIHQARWCDYFAALDLITYQDDKNVIQAANEYLRNSV